MSKLHGIYLANLRKKGVPFGVKIGVSATPEKRARAKNSKSSDFAVLCGEPEIWYCSKAQAQAIERLVKSGFRRFRIETENRTQEIFESACRNRIAWVIPKILKSPRKNRGLVWRAANCVLDLSTAPAAVLFKLDTHRWERNPDPCVTHHINLILKQRFEKFNFFCQTLDQGHAKNVVMKDTPEYTTATYRIDFSIDPDPVSEAPSWRKCRFTVMRFVPTEKLGIEKARSADLRLAGFDRFSVRFTETLSKRTGFQERSVTALSGRRLDKELEAELLKAEFVDD